MALPLMNPYIQQAAMRSGALGSAYGGGMPYGGAGGYGAYGGGYMGGSPMGGYGQRRTRLPILPDQSSNANVSPAGAGRASSDATNLAAADSTNAANAERQQSAGADANKAMQDRQKQVSDAQDKSIAAYRLARDNGIGNDSLAARNNTRKQATDLGIDPSSSAADIAAAASGKVGFDANGMPTGGDTAQGLKPNSPGVAGAAASAQAGTLGTQFGRAISAYSQGYSGATGTGSSPFPRPVATGGLDVRPPDPDPGASPAPSSGAQVTAQMQTAQAAKGGAAPGAVAPQSPSAFPATAPTAGNPPPPVTGGTINGQDGASVVAKLKAANAARSGSTPPLIGSK
jgi:hypothetical protein